MKFGRRLLEESEPRYRHFYIAYKDLKQAIKLITGSDATSFSISQVTHNFGNVPALAGSVFRPPESRFQDLLNHEKEKINKFMEVSLTAVISALKQLLKDLLREDPNDEGYYDDQNLPLREVDQQGEMLMFLKSYQMINRVGFRKITKKYDKHNNSKSSHWYLAQLQRESFINADFNTPLKLLSLCYQIMLARQNSSFGKESLLMSGSINLYTSDGAGAGTAPPVVSHYLVRPEDLMKVKILLAKCLPLISVGTCCFVGREAVDVLINPLAAIQPLGASSTKNKKGRIVEASKYSHGSVYFDSRQFTAIKKVLNGSFAEEESADSASDDFVLRVRWFGIHDGEGDKDIYIERLPMNKLHCGLSYESADLMSEEFTISPDSQVVMLKTKHLNAMLTNSFDLDNWVRRKCIDSTNTDMVRSLLSELQNQLSAGDLLPVLQIWSNRTTFSLTQEDKGPIIEAFVDENICNISQLAIAKDKIIFPNTAAAGGCSDQCIIPFTQIKSEGNVLENAFCTLCIIHPEHFVFPYPLNQPKLDSDKGEEQGKTQNGGGEEESTSLFESELKETSVKQFKTALVIVASLFPAPGFSHFAHAASALYGSLKTFRLRSPAWYKSTMIDNLAGDSDDEGEVETSRASSHGVAGAGGGAASKPPMYSSSSKRGSNRFIADELLGAAANVSVEHISGGGAGGVANNPNIGPQPVELLPAPKYLDQSSSHQPGFLGLDATAIPVQEEPQSGLREPLIESTLGRARSITGRQQNSWLSKLTEWWQHLREPVAAPPPLSSASVRVEPKTFFANERTLLQWMNIAVLISTISITLLSLGGASSRIAGFLLAPIAIYFILHSYAVYSRRTRALLNKEPIDYVDHRGPKVLVVSLVFAMSAVVLLNLAKVFEEEG